MKTDCSLLRIALSSALLLLPLWTSAQIISPLRQELFYKKIIITYDILGLAANQRMEVNIYCSDDGFKKLLTSVSGNGVGPNVVGNGEKTIVWDVLKDRKSLVGAFSFRLNAVVLDADAMLSAARSIPTVMTDSDKKTAAYQEISGTLSSYINEGKNVSRVFNQIDESVFEDPRVSKKINDANIKYNEVYEKLNKNRIAYEKLVLQYWNHDAHTAVQSMNDYALDLHRLNILSLNEALHTVNQINTEQISGRKNEKEAREKSLRTIQHHSAELEKKLNELELRYTRTVSMLEHK